MKEFDIPEPKVIAPEMTKEQRAAMEPVDLLVQYIMPKLWDKVNRLEWETKRALHEANETMEFLQGQIDKIGGDCARNILEMANRLDAMERAEPTIRDVRRAIDNADKKRRGRKKKEEVEEEKPDAEPVLKGAVPPESGAGDVEKPVETTKIAQYDPDTDSWVPFVINGVAITGPVVANVMKSGCMEDGQPYHVDVAAFVYDLLPEERKALQEMFPTQMEAMPI